jgi:hypothetical protein
LEFPRTGKRDESRDQGNTVLLSTVTKKTTTARHSIKTLLSAEDRELLAVTREKRAPAKK